MLVGWPIWPLERLMSPSKISNFLDLKASYPAILEMANKINVHSTHIWPSDHAGAWTPASPATTLPQILQALSLQHLLPDPASLLHSR